MSSSNETLQLLVKALEAGSYNAAPSSLTQGAALQVEDLSTVMTNVTFGDKQLKLQQMLRTESCKSTLAQFDRQLSYGQFGGSAQLEGGIGQEETSDYVRIVVPMCYYSHTRRVTLVSTMVATVDGKKADDRAAADAAIKIAGDIEFDCLRGRDGFSNGGVFDGNPLAVGATPNMSGAIVQIRQSDIQTNTQDLMFNEFGSDESVVINAGGTLAQSMIEDAAARSAQNHGDADKLLVDIKVLATYNKIAFNKERILLAGSPQDNTGADLRRQWVAGGVVQIEGSRFLAGKTSPARSRAGGPLAPSFTGARAAGTTAFPAGAAFRYEVTSVNEKGESSKSPAATVTTTTAGDQITLTITPPSGGTARYFNVYRSNAGGTATAFIGSVKNSGLATTVFVDLGNRIPAYVTGLLVQGDTMYMPELAGYSRAKLAQTDLSTPEAHFRFVTLATTDPRKNVVLDNLAS